MTDKVHPKKFRLRQQVHSLELVCEPYVVFQRITFGLRSIRRYRTGKYLRKPLGYWLDAQENEPGALLGRSIR